MPTGPLTTFSFSANEIAFLQSILIEFQSGCEARNSELQFEILENVLAILEGRTPPYPSV